MNRIPIWMRLLRWYSLNSPFQRGTYRVALWLYQHLPVPDAEIETILDRTLWVSLRLRIWVDYNIYCLGLYEKPLAHFFIRSLLPDSVVVDIGAYIGQYTLLAAKYAPEGQVIAFEPHPDSFARLTNHIARNRLNRVCAFQRAVGRRGEHLSLVLSEQVFDSFLRPSERLGEVVAEVEVTSLDEMVQELGLEKLSLVKIDVEGAEGEVLRGAEQTLTRFRPTLIVEMDRSAEEAWGDSPQELLAQLKQYGYALHILDSWHIRPISPCSLNYANIIAIPL